MRLIVTALAALPRTSARAPWPERPITLMLPFQAGGSADLVDRILQQHRQGDFGSPVIVQDRPGAGGRIGVACVVKAADNGDTPPLGTNRFVHRHLPYDAALAATSEYRLASAIVEAAGVPIG